MVQTPFILLVCFILFAITWPLTTLLHELGHGIPSLLFTRKPVTLYIGSYGVKKGSVSIKLGRLRIYLKYNPFAWWKGLCLFENDTLRLYQQVIILVAGPAASLLVSTVCCYFAFSFDLHGSIKLILVALVFSSLMDLYFNIIPREEPITLADGRLAFNDGKQLKMLFRYRSLYLNYRKAIALYEQQLYKQALEAFISLIQGGLTEDFVYRTAISACMQEHDYQQAKLLDEQLAAQFAKNATDYASSGLLKARLTQYEEGLEDFSKALALDPALSYTWGNRGYTYLLLGDYHQALADFDQALLLDATDAYD
jgi:hypothetical protein